MPASKESSREGNDERCRDRGKRNETREKMRSDIARAPKQRSERVRAASPTPRRFRVNATPAITPRPMPVLPPPALEPTCAMRWSLRFLRYSVRYRLPPPR